MLPLLSLVATGVVGEMGLLDGAGGDTTDCSTSCPVAGSTDTVTAWPDDRREEASCSRAAFASGTADDGDTAFGAAADAGVGAEALLDEAGPSAS